jgi:peptidyl-tRNA hydrolase, PTH1 family
MTLNTYTRHNIGFRVVESLAETHQGIWQQKNNMEVAEVRIGDHTVLLIKPLTFMNNSGKILPDLARKGITAGDLLVIHDELELPFGQVKFKSGGSAKGHNGLKSIIAHIGDGFDRLRIGISRPENREEVPDYVLKNFSESKSAVEDVIMHAANMIEKSFS